MKEHVMLGKSQVLLFVAKAQFLYRKMWVKGILEPDCQGSGALWELDFS